MLSLTKAFPSVRLANVPQYLQGRCSSTIFSLHFEQYSASICITRNLMGFCQMTLVLYMYGATFDLINTKNGTMERGHIPNFDGT